MEVLPEMKFINLVNLNVASLGEKRVQDLVELGMLWAESVWRGCTGGWGGG
jgi:hypothetical protein